MFDLKDIEKRIGDMTPHEMLQLGVPVVIGLLIVLLLAFITAWMK